MAHIGIKYSCINPTTGKLQLCIRAYYRWDETNFLGRDRDRDIRFMKIHNETETEKKWMLIF